MKDRIVRILVLLYLLFFIIVVAINNIWSNRVAILQKQNEILLKDNQQLSNDLQDRENEIYKLNLEMAQTEKALANTANELEEAVATLQGQEALNIVYAGEYTCTAYCTEKYAHICGGGGNTASGAPVTADVSVAATDLKKFPYGTVIYIEGIGIRIVQDTGGFSKNKLDIAVKTHKEATHWKTSKHKVWIVEVK